MWQSIELTESKAELIFVLYLHISGNCGPQAKCINFAEWNGKGKVNFSAPRNLKEAEWKISFRFWLCCKTTYGNQHNTNVKLTIVQVIVSRLSRRPRFDVRHDWFLSLQNLTTRRRSRFNMLVPTDIIHTFDITINSPFVKINHPLNPVARRTYRVYGNIGYKNFL